MDRFRKQLRTLKSVISPSGLQQVASNTVREIFPNKYIQSYLNPKISQTSLQPNEL